MLDESNISKSEFVSQRARDAYVAAVCRTDVTFCSMVASRGTNLDVNDVKALNKALSKCLENPNLGLRFVKLENSSLFIAVFVDAVCNTASSSNQGLQFCLF